MDTKFKRHQHVKLLSEPKEEDIEPYADPPKKIKKGMVGQVNIILPNGRYHVKIADAKDNEIAYVAMDEEFLEAVDKPPRGHNDDENVEDWAHHQK